MDRPMKIFLSGPITSRLDTYKKEFESAAEAVKAAGNIPLNPATQPLGLEQRDYMRVSLAMLEAADMVLLLPGWEESEGALVEQALAAKLGIPTKPLDTFVTEWTASIRADDPKPERPISRVERVFGKRETWNQTANSGGETLQTTEDAPIPVRGFIIAECEECGNVAAFTAREPISYTHCKLCGHDTPLDKRTALPAYAECTCGKEAKYRTNATSSEIEIPCIKCGSRIGLKRNEKGNAYRTATVRE